MATTKGKTATVDYTLRPGETIAQWNARTGGSASVVAPTMSTTQTVDKAKAMLAQTKAEGTTPFAGSSFEKTYLSKYPAPTDASKVGTPFPPLNTPALGPDMGNISDAVAGNKGLEAMLALQQKQADERMKMEQQRQQEQKGLLDKFMGSVTSPWQAREQAIKDTGIDPQEYFAQQEKGIKEIESLTNDYNRVVEAKDAQIAATQDKMGSMNFINNQTAQIERNAAPQLNRLSAQINAKAATLQALQGNFAEARSYVNQAVQDATADTKFKYDMMKMVYDMNEDSFDRVDSIYSDAYKGAMAIAEMQYQEDLAEKQLIGEYMLKYPSAGLTMQDSLEDASRKLSASGAGDDADNLTADMRNFYLAQQDPKFAEWMGKTENSSVNYTQVMQDAINQGATPEEAARAAATVSEADGIPVDQDVLASFRRAASQMTKQAPQVKETTISAPSGNYSTSSGGGGGITLTSIWNSLFGN